MLRLSGSFRWGAVIGQLFTGLSHQSVEADCQVQHRHPHRGRSRHHQNERRRFWSRRWRWARQLSFLPYLKTDRFSVWWGWIIYRYGLYKSLNEYFIFEIVTIVCKKKKTKVSFLKTPSDENAVSGVFNMFMLHISYYENSAQKLLSLF